MNPSSIKYKSPGTSSTTRFERIHTIIFDNKNSVIADPTSDACEFSRKNFSLIPSLKFDTSI